MNPVIFPILSPIKCPLLQTRTFPPISRLRRPLLPMQSPLPIARSSCCRSTARALKGSALHRGQTRHVVAGAEMLALEHRAVLSRHHSDEFGGVAVPVGQYALGKFAPRVLMMAHDQRVDALDLFITAKRP